MLYVKIIQNIVILSSGKYMLKKIMIAVLASVYMYGDAALADCYHNGNSYKEGTALSGYICENGKWRKYEE